MRSNHATLPERLQSVALRYRARCTSSAWGFPVDRRGDICNLLREESDGTSPPVDSVSSDSRTARLEAILLIAREPLSSRKLAQLASLADGTEARTLVRRLNGRYDEEGTAFRVQTVAGGYQLMTRSQFGGWLRRLYEAPQSDRLSSPTMETLAVVAYRQPILRAEIEAIRGVGCGEILRQLMQRDLIRISGRGDELGRPFLYGTTKRFLQVFGLRYLEDLPRADALRVTSSSDAQDGISSNTHNSAFTSDTKNEEESAVSVFDTDHRRDIEPATGAPAHVDADSADPRGIVSEDELHDDDLDDDAADDDDDEYDDDEYEDDDEDDDDEYEDDPAEDDLDDDDDDEWEEVDDEYEDEEFDDDDDEWEYYDDDEDKVAD